MQDGDLGLHLVAQKVKWAYKPSAARAVEVLGTIVATYGTAAIGVLGGVILARTLTPADRGALATALIWPSIVAMLGELGLGSAFAYFAGIGTDTSVIWTMSICVSAAIGGLLMVGGIATVFFLKPAGLVAALSLGFVSIPLTLDERISDTDSS